VGSLERSMKGELISRHHDVRSSSHGTWRMVSPSSFVSETLDLNPTKIDSERSLMISPHKLPSGTATMTFLRLSKQEQLLWLKVIYYMCMEIQVLPLTHTTDMRDNGIDFSTHNFNPPDDCFTTCRRRLQPCA